MTDTLTVRAEALTGSGFAPFGQVIATGDMVMELRDDEVFHLNVLSYDRRPLRCDHLNRHNRASQALIALGGRPTVVVVAPADLDFSTKEHLGGVRAFICDGTAGINLALGTWHWGPYPLMEHVDLVNIQGRGFADDNQIAHLERDLNAVITVTL